ncbi:interleukin 12Ba precursor [Hippocampus comes]|uniref:interleukin 12Ba precursor n=1 Tax=Hippocampus comes TaxID=109280 RepID=UPI00094E806B|nr:PREDICTED: interleukin-12 subunit beta [Hippocampus comes]
MNFIDYILMCAFLHVGYQNPLSSWTLQPNVLVVKVNGSPSQQALKCLHSAEGLTNGDDKDILWKKNGREEKQRGNSYLVQLEESLGGGRYSCYSTNGSLLNHTVVLIQEDTTRRKILMKTDQEEYLKCSTQNFEGAFRCSWTWHRTRFGKVALIRAGRGRDVECSVDASGQRWTCSSGQGQISCSVDGTGDGISCVDKRHCAFAEEKHRIFLTVYVKTEHFLVESYSKHFYLSEIVKPDKVKIRRVNTSMIEVTYPSSWSSPSSYFPLTFQVSQSTRGCKNCDNPCENPTAAETVMVNSSSHCRFEVKSEFKTVCVRAKDALYNSQWSDWSHLSTD